jgi:hypothetical protein
MEVWSNKGPGPLQRGDNCKTVKMGCSHLKIFSRTTGPTLTRLSTNHPWREGIHVYSKEGDCPSPKEDNSERVKIHWKFLKIFSRTSRPKSIKLGTNYPWVKGIQVFSNKGPDPFQRGDNRRNLRKGWGYLKILFLRTMKPEKLNFTWKHSDIEQRQGG